MDTPAIALPAPELVRLLKEDLGMIVRRSEAETLTEDEFKAIARRMRRCLNVLEMEVSEAERGMVELTDLGATIGRLTEAGVIQPRQELFRDAPNRARAYRHLVAIDGGVTTP